MSREEIEKYYDNTYSSRYNELAKQKNDALSQLDGQYEKGKAEYYGQRNTASLGNAQQTQRIRDYMAKNNLMGSGESVDAQLRSATDFSNAMGGIQRSENDFNKGIEDNRFKVNRNFDSDANALRADLDAQKGKALMEWKRQEEQLAIQREQLAMQRQAQAQAAAARQAASQPKNQMPTDPQQALAMLRMEAMKDPLRVGTYFSTQLANTPGMEYVVQEAQEYAKNWRYYADLWGISQSNARDSQATQY